MGGESDREWSWKSLGRFLFTDCCSSLLLMVIYLFFLTSCDCGVIFVCVCCVVQNSGWSFLALGEVSGLGSVKLMAFFLVWLDFFISGFLSLFCPLRFICTSFVVTYSLGVNYNALILSEGSFIHFVDFSVHCLRHQLPVTVLQVSCFRWCCLSITLSWMVLTLLVARDVGCSIFL